MNRPDKKNALTLDMYEAMTAALEGANADDSVHCVLIAGVPGAFTAGQLDRFDILSSTLALGIGCTSINETARVHFPRRR